MDMQDGLLPWCEEVLVISPQPVALRTSIAAIPLPRRMNLREQAGATPIRLLDPRCVLLGRTNASAAVTHTNPRRGRHARENSILLNRVARLASTRSYRAGAEDDFVENVSRTVVSVYAAALAIVTQYVNPYR